MDSRISFMFSCEGGNHGILPSRAGEQLFMLEEIVIEKFDLLGNSRILNAYIGGDHVLLAAPVRQPALASTFTWINSVLVEKSSVPISCTLLNVASSVVSISLTIRLLRL